MTPKKFLDAEWRKLIMANYLVEPALLQPYIPAKTEPDTWQGNTYISLVGFMFRETKVMGIKVPYHINFPEVNLRFYVRYKENNEYKRGVVFIKEIVPKPAISYIANTLFHERYVTLPMKHHTHLNDNRLHVGYQWKHKKRWNSLEVVAGKEGLSLAGGSEEEFITEHFWGYSAINKNKTGEYKVAHPRWEIYPVQQYSINCNFGELYGSDFTILSDQTPCSVFLAEGSPISVYQKRVI